METGRIIGTILVVCFIGPAFWLLVNIAENKIKSLWLNRRRGQQSTSTHSNLQQKLLGKFRR